jgi:nuclear migration protein JNM1
LSDSDEETLSSRIARLRREAEEIRLELERREEGEFKEALEDQENGQEEGVAELIRILQGLHTSSAKGTSTSEEEFVKHLVSSQRQPLTPPRSQLLPKGSQATTTLETSPSTTAAIAAFSDRLTALETALGVSSVIGTNETSSILPTLASLTSQITTLTSTLAPPRTQTTSATSTQPSAIPLPALDAIATRIRTLIAESDKLALSRKAALQSLTDLHDARLRQSSTTPSYPHHSHHASSRPASRHQAHPSQANTDEQQLHAQLFLDEQSAKISALYHTLPTIQDLSPLLPVMLERLRSLSVVHAGAAEARAEMDEVEQKQGELAREIEKWKGAVEGVEAQMKEMQDILRGNVEVVGAMVKGVEERVSRLEGSGTS